jgi:hypothetical protein
MTTTPTKSYREQLRLYLLKVAVPVADQQTWAKLIYCRQLPENFFKYIYEQLKSHALSPLDALKELEKFNDSGFSQIEDFV